MRELQAQGKKAEEELEAARLLHGRASDEAAALRSEVAQLRGVIEEGDRSREILVRELARQKEVEADRVRDSEARREAELKL